MRRRALVILVGGLLVLTACNPKGSVDVAEPEPGGGIRVQGWARDPDTKEPIDVHVYVDGKGVGVFQANQPRPDVQVAEGETAGPNHGFNGVVTAGPGVHEVCVYGIDKVNTRDDTNALIGCRFSSSGAGNTPPVNPQPGFGDGTYQVNVTVAPGTYRTRAAATGCYWERLSGFGGTFSEIIANDFLNGTAIVTIAPTDVGFRTSGCGRWYSDLSPIKSSPTSPITAGTYFVGATLDVAPGTWQSTGGNGCYWARLRSFTGTFSDIIANDFGNAPTIVTISPSDVGFETNAGCGQWNKIG
jgi:hypothetical protein